MDKHRIQITALLNNDKKENTVFVSFVLTTICGLFKHLTQLNVEKDKRWLVALLFKCGE